MSKFKPNEIIVIKKEQENTKLTPRQVRQWSSISGMGNKMMKIWKFKLSVSAKSAMSQGLKGKDIGDYIKNKESELFSKMN